MEPIDAIQPPPFDLPRPLFPYLPGISPSLACLLQEVRPYFVRLIENRMGHLQSWVDAGTGDVRDLHDPMADVVDAFVRNHPSIFPRPSLDQPSATTGVLD